MTAALVYLAILVVAFFLLIVLPQRRRLSTHRALVDAMAVGDEIVTTAGVHGVVRRIDDSTLQLEIAPGVVITLARGAVSQRRPAGSTPDPALDLSQPESHADVDAASDPTEPADEPIAEHRATD